MKTIITSLVLSFCFFTANAQIVKEGYRVNDPTRAWFKAVKNNPDLTIDHVNNSTFEVWGPAGLGKWLAAYGADFVSVTKETLTHLTDYPSYEEQTATLKAIATSYPKTAKLFSIGKSTEGRELWIMKVSRNVIVDDSRPEFKFIANMHGDEIVGRELMTYLIQDLLQNDGKDAAITKMLNEIQIYIMPSMNPDGAFHVTRGNAAFIDLNRNFPEYTKNESDNPNGRGVETQAMMKFQALHKFKLSANFHGGAEVVNYPWDAIPDAHPLDNYLKTLSLDYAKLAPYIAASTDFQNGITNGYAWYEVLGGMQDWSNRFYGDIQLTIELSNTKWPGYSDVAYYWQQNRTAMLDFISKTTATPKN